MALIPPELLVLIVIGLVIILFWLYIGSLEKVFEQIGFSRGEAGTVIFLTLFLGTISIPLFPYKGWWVGINIGGALIPIILCYVLLRSRRVLPAEGIIGVIIVAYITYFLTRAEQNVGIVADFPWAFAPATAAGFFAISTFWMDIRKAAPLAYFSGVLGTLIGADVFHLGDILKFPAPTSPAGGINLLSIGGAEIFDLVYLSGIIAVFVDIVVFWIKRQEKKHGFERIVSELEKQSEGQPYAKEPQVAAPPQNAPVPRMSPPIEVQRRGRVE